jgi:transposase InsO family protein
MNHIYILPNKKQETQLRTIQDFAAYVETRWNCNIRIFELDRESGLGSQWDDWIAEKGITKNQSPPYTQDQNGGAERSEGVVIIKSRALKIASRLPSHLWPEIACATGYILNRTPKRGLG